MKSTQRFPTLLRSSLVALAASLAAACGTSAAEPTHTETVTTPDDPFAGIEDNLTALATDCTFNATTGVMTVAVVDGETAIISKRPTDSVIVQNGYPCTTVATSSTVKQIVITGSTGDETVIMDYTNGLFATGTSSATSGVSINMGTSTGTDVVGIRAQNSTTAGDKVTFGATGVALNADAFKDITFATNEADSYTVSLADGADTFSSAGGTTLGVGAKYGGASPITVYGGAGNDTFEQGATFTLGETIYGGSGTDTVTYALRTTAVTLDLSAAAGAADADDGDGTNSEVDDVKDDVEVVTGGTVADDLAGANNAVTLNGGAGADTLTGGDGADTLNGDAANDILQGGDGNDTYNGGEGDDSFVAEDEADGADAFNGGNGTDTVDYSARATNGVVVTMDGVAATDGETGELDNVKLDCENLVGTDQVDTITGNTKANVITGGLGDDALSGGDGDDVFDEGGDPGAGDDDDTIVGGNGVDAVDYSGRTEDLTVTLDNSTASGDLTAGEGDTIDCENATGGSGLDSLTGNSGPNELNGGGANDDLFGLAGDDILDGGGGTNDLQCGAGDGDIGFNGTKTACEF